MRGSPWKAMNSLSSVKHLICTYLEVNGIVHLKPSVCLCAELGHSQSAQHRNIKSLNGNPIVSFCFKQVLLS